MGQWNEGVFIALGCVLFALLGAFVKWLNENGKSANFFLLLTDASSAVFGGLLVYFTFEWLELSGKLACATSGVVGHLGIGGVRMIIKVYCKRLNLPLPEENGTGKQGETE